MAIYFDSLSTFPMLYYSLALLFGLCIGSFLNVVIYRLPIMLEQSWRQEAKSVLELPADQPTPARYNLATPASSCPHCGHQIRWFENIPLLSYLALRGRCSQCANKISVRYPLVEVVTAGLTVFLAMATEPSLAAMAWMVFLWSLIALTGIDLDTQLLPDQITLPLLWLGLLASLTGITKTPLDAAVLGAILGYLSLWSIYHVFRLLTGKEGMGYGDFKLFAAFGAWFGWTALPVIILLSSLVGAVVGISMMVLLGRDRQLPIAFGPYLCGAALVYFFWGDWLVSTYISWAMG